MKLVSSVFALILSLLGLPTDAAAASSVNVYVAQSAAGIADGSSCGNARSITFFNTATNWGGGSTQIGAGSTVHLCGIITTGLVAQGSGNATNPIIILFETGAKISVGSCGSTGCLNISGKAYIIVDGGTNGIIEATNSGTGLGSADSVGIYGRAGMNHCEVRNLTINNMYVHNSVSDNDPGTQYAVWFDGTNNLFHNNIIHDAMAGFVGESPNSFNSFFSNTISDINWGVFLSGSSSSSSNVHDDLIYGNDICCTQNWDTTADTFHHDGIFVSGEDTAASGTNHIDIYNNYIHGPFSTCPSVCATAMIYMNAASNIRIFNNLLVAQPNDYVNNGWITIGTAGYADSSNAIYHNTVIGGTSAGSGNCIAIINELGLSVENNVVSNCGVLMWLKSGSVSTLDHNIYQNASITNGIWRQGSTFYNSLAAWRTASGGDANAQATTGSLNLDSNYKPLSNSMAKQAGINLGSLNIVALDSDKSGLLRPSGSAAWDAGPYQSSNGTSAPNSPSGLITQVQ